MTENTRDEIINRVKLCKLKTYTAASLLLLFAVFADAETFYVPSGAIPDQYSILTGDHALVLFDLFGKGQHGYFDLVEATFGIREDSTAFLSGKLQRQGFPNQRLAIELEFTDLHTVQTGMRMLELKPEAYAPIGPVDPSTWVFYYIRKFDIIGLDDLSGAIIRLRPNLVMPEMQLGVGASGKNILFGFSGWLKYLVKCQPDIAAIQFEEFRGKGDWHVQFETEGANDPGCTFSQGYWKRHQEVWPVDNLFLGNVNYTKVQLLLIFDEPVRGNGLISLSHQLIATKLNVAYGADDSVIADTVIIADALIGDLVVPPIGIGFLPTDAVSPLVELLTVYNEGTIGPGHCTRRRHKRLKIGCLI
ncbi:hypothetical protein L0152_14325 [bacterium]|nr:hypothetical protein [bacterium]